MSTRRATVLPLTYDAIPRVHRRCASSTFWEFDPLVFTRASVNPEVDKEAWLTAQSFHQGICGFNIVERDTERRAFATVLFCPQAEAPGAIRFPSGPLGKDAYALTSMHIDAAAAHRGWESVLLDATIMTLSERGVPAIEAFGINRDYTGEMSDLVRNLSTQCATIGLVDTSVLEAAGFKVVQQHPVLPRLRLDLPPEQSLLTAHEIEQLLHEVPATR